MPLLLTSCTKRKRAKATILASDLQPDSLENTAREWVTLTEAASELHEAKVLYSGRSIKEIRDLVNSTEHQAFILSAGLGLVQWHDKIPSYDLTIQGNGPASIQTRIVEPIGAVNWWTALTSAAGTINPVSKLVSDHPDELVIIACPMNYVLMISEDLRSLIPEDLKRVRLFGPRNKDDMPVHLRELVMPYNENFDGPESPNPGTRVDFPQRICRHFVEHVLPGCGVASGLDEHSSAVTAFMSELPAPESVKRTSMNDEQIIQLIAACWDEAHGQSGKMLRVLRDDKKVACEQGRFAALFREAKERISQ